MSIATLWDQQTTKPYKAIYFFDTPYTVKSHGPVAEWYTFATTSANPVFDSSDIRWVSNVPFIKWYSGASYPLELSPNFNNSNQFGVVYTGKFQAQSASATFFLAGYGKSKIELQGQSASATILLGDTESEIASYHVSGLTPDDYYTLTIHYWSLGKDTTAKNSFVVTWIDSTLPKAMPLSAGYYFSPNDVALGVSSYKLEDIGDAEVLIDKNQTNKLSFTIPLGTLSERGYRYVSSGDYFQHNVSSNVQIKRHRMVELHTGYVNSIGAIATTKRFVGQIRDWTINRSTNEQKVIIECYDWTIFLSDAINLGYPNVSDYLAFGYTSTDTNGVSLQRPRAYDGWLMEDVVDSLLVNAYIDPKTLLQKKTHTTVDGVSVTGGYLFFDRNQATKIYLDRNINYGNPLTIYNEDADDRYVWQFSIGESLNDNLSKVMNNYGFNYGFNDNGNFYVDSVENPFQIKSIDEMTFYGSWTETTNTRGLFAVYKQTSVANASVLATFIGTSAELVVGVGSTFGTLHVAVSNPTLGVVATGTFWLKANSDHFYYDGVDDSLGYNPSKIQIGSNWSYGSYEVKVVQKNGNINVNGLVVYDSDFLTPAHSFYTGATLSKRGVIVNNYDVSFLKDSVRNDVLVVGRLLGIQSSLSVAEDNRDQLPINPNNPVAEHIVSRAIDRSSIGSISASNYVGRPLQMIIVEPSIAEADRANWLASETVKRYNNNLRNATPRITVPGNPLVKLNDLIRAYDIKLAVLSTTYWVSGIRESFFGNGKYSTQLTLEGQKPWQSYYRYPFPSLGRFNSQVFQNVKTYNTGLPYKSNTDPVTFYTIDGATPTWYFHYHNKDNNPSLSAQDVKDLFPNDGYIQLIRPPITNNIGIPITATIQEIVKYDGKPTVEKSTLVNNGWRYTLGFKVARRGIYSTATQANTTHWEGQPANLSISPFISEETGQVPGVQFDLIMPGFIRVSVNDKANNLLDVLTANVVPEDNSGWVFVKPGRYYYSWGMFDRVGDHNVANTKKYRNKGIEYKIGAGYYVENDLKSSNVRTDSQFNFLLQFRDNRRELILDQQSSTAGPIAISKYYENDSSLSPDIDGSVIIRGSFQHPSTYIHDLSNAYGSSGVLTSKACPYYTGSENNGSGARFYLWNVSPSPSSEHKRIVDVQINRYIYLFGSAIVHGDYTPDEMGTTGLVYSGKEEIFNDTLVFSGDVKTVFIQPPRSLPFVTEKAWQFLSFYPKQAAAISHIHIFDVLTTDMSGRKSNCQFATCWIPVPFASGGISQFGGPDPAVSYYYDVIRFSDFDLGAKNIDLSGYENPYPSRDITGPFVQGPIKVQTEYTINNNGGIISTVTAPGLYAVIQNMAACVMYGKK